MFTIVITGYVTTGPTFNRRRTTYQKPPSKIDPISVHMSVPHTFRCDLLYLLCISQVFCVSREKCATFARFASKWEPNASNLAAWSRQNCDKIQPRPADMTCRDVLDFVVACDFGSFRYNDASSSMSTAGVGSVINRQRDFGPRELNKYIPCNGQTVTDYGHFGNWYYPNCYPSAYLGYFDNSPMSMAQLEDNYKFAKGGHYPYNRADNIVNIALQQTMLPTCLHDVIYCIRLSNAQRYQQYYKRQQLEEERRKRRKHLRIVYDDERRH